MIVRIKNVSGESHCVHAPGREPLTLPKDETVDVPAERVSPYMPELRRLYEREAIEVDEVDESRHVPVVVAEPEVDPVPPVLVPANAGPRPPAPAREAEPPAKDGPPAPPVVETKETKP